MRILVIQGRILQIRPISRIFLFLAFFCFFRILWVSLKKTICRLIVFGKEDPRYIPLRKLGLSKRVADVLIKKEELISINPLIIVVIYDREYLLEMEDLDKKEKEEIFRKIDEFLNNSWALTALFYCNFDKLNLKPWWYRLIVYISRKRKDPAFFFISELKLSTRITRFFMEEKIYTIEDLLIIIKDTHSSKWKRLLQSEDFEYLAYFDFLEIYGTIHYFLHC